MPHLSQPLLLPWNYTFPKSADSYHTPSPARQAQHAAPLPLHSRRLRRHLAKLNRFSSFNLSSLAGNLERKQMLTPYRFKLLL